MKALTITVLSLLLFLAAGAPQGYKVGDVAQPFMLKDAVSDQMVGFEKYHDAKGLIVIFSCNHCPYVVAYENRMIELHNEFAPKGWPVIAINPNDPQRQPEDGYEMMQIRAKEKKFPFAYLHDNTQLTARTYGATRTPHVYLLQKEEEAYVVKYIGAIDDNVENPEKVKKRYVAEAIKALEAGKTVEPNTTKAIGCTIKWADKGE